MIITNVLFMSTYHFGHHHQCQITSLTTKSRPDCSGKETAHFVNKPSSKTPKKEVHVDKGQPKGNSLRCEALEE